MEGSNGRKSDPAKTEVNCEEEKKNGKKVEKGNVCELEEPWLVLAMPSKLKRMASRYGICHDDEEDHVAFDMEDWEFIDTEYITARNS
ncbi:unnamed protein product [Cuscuta campestris]|uniref:Uncharacterized protein n=1 Tax=Cuscuta campestris TaxID=132261 RepID=A0A484KFE6_9ASTE|nr:unnamed protein product [Cuscuta campestris]